MERRTGKDRRSGHERRQSARKREKMTIAVVDTDKQQSRQLCELLATRQYIATPLYSLNALEKTIAQAEHQAILWDLDTVPVENRIIKDLTLRFPGVHFFGLSRHQFHPELKDAICYHIYACLNRPIDPDELFYWLKSIEENALEPDKPASC